MATTVIIPKLGNKVESYKLKPRVIKKEPSKQVVKGVKEEKEIPAAEKGQ